MIKKTKHLTQGDRIVKCVCMSPAVVVQGAMIQEMVKCDSKRSLRTYSQVLLDLYLVSTDRNINNAIIKGDQTWIPRSRPRIQIIETNQH